jgi:3-hydroxy acid dehydrogenase / malonic semialdehyde reductase
VAENAGRLQPMVTADVGGDMADTPFATTPLNAKRVLVTGGTTGIGRTVVLRLAREGARILTFGRHEQPMRQTLGLAGLPAQAGITADVSRRDEVERVFAAVDERLGGIDILVCCAALGADPLLDMPEEDWRYAVETNLLGYMSCTRAAVERMVAQGAGHVVLISSISADILAPGESVYAATKAGIDAFALTLRKEVADRNVRVSLIAPGSVGSDMQECDSDEQRRAIARQEMLFAEEVAEAVLFVLTRSGRCDVADLRIEPLRQKVA